MGFQRLFSRTAQSYCSHVRVRLLGVSQAVGCHFTGGTAQRLKQTTTPCTVSSLFKRFTFNTGRDGATSTPTLPFGLSSRILPTFSKTRSMSTSTLVSKDVTLFQHDRTTFFRLLAVFCGGQCLFWTYLAHFAFTGLRDTKDRGQASTTTTTTGLAGPWSFDMNLGSSSWRYAFTLGCLAIGGGIAALGALFCSRCVSRVVLHRGGQMVTVFTQSPLGPDRGRRITVPLSQVACHAHRLEAPSFIPLRVKGHKFYFLLDKDGTLNNTKLFDVTVGAYRPV